MTTPDPQALYAACQRLERATGRKIVPPWIEWTGCRFHIRDDSYAWCCNDEAAARILRDALWEAVREWCKDNGVSWNCPPSPLKAITASIFDDFNPATAADAISEFVEKQKAARLPQ